MTSTQTTISQQTVGIVPYSGLYTEVYTKDEWVNDVVAYSEYYYSNLPYQKGIANDTSAVNWMLVILFFGFISLAYVRSVHRKRFSMLVQTFINWKVAKQIIRYEKVYTHPVNILLNLNFLFCFPLFLSLSAFHLTNPGYSISEMYLLIILPFLLYLISKLVLYKFSAWLLVENETIEEYVFQASLFNKYLGVCYLILTTLLIYSPISSSFLSKIGLGVLFLFLSFQLIRGVIIGIEKGKNLYLIILYLCTLEILPWLVLGKWVKNLM